MLYKKTNISLILLLMFLLINSSLFTQEQDDNPDLYDDPAYEGSSLDDPAASLPQPEIDEPIPEPRYTDLEFSNLPVEEKRNIYFNFPELLPENFDPDVYMHIFHPQTEDTE